MKKSLKRGNSVKKRPSYSNYPKKKESSLTSKQEAVFIKTCVSLILIIAVFFITRVGSEKADVLKAQLKTAITENISFDEAKEYGEKGIEVIKNIKESQTERMEEIFDNEMLLPNDAALSN